MDAKWTIRDEIAYYEKYGKLSRPIMGGSGEGDNVDDSGAGGDGDNEQDDPKTFTEEEVNRIVKTRLARAKDSIRAEVLDAFKKEQEREKKRKEGEFDQLLKEREDEISKLTAKVANLEVFEELAEERFASIIKDVPEAIRMLAPDDDASPLDKERWLTKKAMPALKKLEEESRKNTQGNKGLNPKDPKPTSKKEADEGQFNKLVEAARASGSYRF